ncbi:RNAse P Rpr2/Rpp21/SNM1 subunit domain-containing protein [Triangularia verruculosa]|uniref:RNAse P Rpr2/Rpp21/SNM1 subunit domain-containing protein n=1 Tax=Triangularia verruculosa TaxID=2587418 RepID=A0AAN6XFG8_9PEZI|nr:RNAse P Rpr2/Rpp21/SNM1 subunit domain-containing protein [Triangularia verruculosa]
MAKAKTGGVQNKAIYSRLSFLQQAAVFLSTATLDGKSADTSEPKQEQNAPLQGVGRRLATDLRAVSLKSRIRLNPAVKQSICKFCDSILIDGDSCTPEIENKSNGGRKPWADVLVRKCHTCGKERRYPVNAKRPKRKTGRPVATTNRPDLMDQTG